MSVFLKRGLLKDRQAGLIFYWRSIGKRGVVGYVLGFLAASAIIVFLLYGIKVKVPHLSVRENNRIYQVAIRQTGDPAIGADSLVDYSQLESWDPIEDVAVNNRILEMSSDLILSTNPRKLKLLGPNFVESTKPTIGTVTTQASMLADRKYQINEVEKIERKCVYSVRFEINSQSSRLSSSPVLEADTTLLGESQQFIISLSPEGEVVLCTPIGRAELPKAESYLRKVKFKPSDGNLDQLIQLSIHVEEVVK